MIQQSILVLMMLCLVLIHGDSQCAGINNEQCYWTDCGTTTSEIGDVNKDGYKLVSWTNGFTQNQICNYYGSVGNPLHPPGNCCGAYGSGCWKGYKGLWCKRPAGTYKEQRPGGCPDYLYRTCEVITKALALDVCSRDKCTFISPNGTSVDCDASKKEKCDKFLALDPTVDSCGSGGCHRMKKIFIFKKKNIYDYNYLLVLMDAGYILIAENKKEGVIDDTTEMPKLTMFNRWIVL
ncbi:uncharacterized protein BX664DRAFT_313735 [Halteromyces radiatus]|uniref:uncharacterized protein n=1 Tax=Halteromyces radiatus TaxID=101107 RepID=UPI0022206346|nr:uncharacterized protein BX664DRAFT_313735 [Halteromyces radiatus]KAI8093715.1 hypothetical protein BX664DRAFT_313735 [Halteromyces radiatus]